MVPNGFSLGVSLVLSRLVFLRVHGAVGTGRGVGPSLTQGGRKVVRCAGFEALASSLPAGIAFVNTLYIKWKIFLLFYYCYSIFFCVLI